MSHDELKQDALKVIQLLRGYLWHTTSVNGFAAIHRNGRIKVNRGDLQSAYEQSRLSNCFEQGGISLFDLVTHRDEDLVGDDLLLLEKWPNVMFHHTPTIFLGVELPSVASNLLFYSELKRRCGFGGVIPRIEVCHVGDIPFHLIKRVAVRKEAQMSNIEFYDDIADATRELLPK